HLRPVQPAIVQVRRFHPLAPVGPVCPAAWVGLPARLPGGGDGPALRGGPALFRQRCRPAGCRRLLRPAAGGGIPGDKGHSFSLGRLGAGPGGARTGREPGSASPGAGHPSEGVAAWLKLPCRLRSSPTPAATATAGATGATPLPANRKP